MSGGRLTRLVVAALLWWGDFGWAAAESSVPSRPEELLFSELRLPIPDARMLRRQLKSGAVAYVVEDQTLPLVDVVMAVKTGDDPPNKTGLGSLTGHMIRQGGTKRLSAEELDDLIDALGAEVGVETSVAYLDCTQGVLEDALPLFFEMLREPGFQEDRLLLARERIRSRMKGRNDDPLEVLEREWRWLLHDRGDPPNQEVRPGDLEAIQVVDLASFHRHRWRPDSMVLAISGAVDTDAVLALVDASLSGWSTSEEGVSVRDSQQTSPPRPGVYHMEHGTPQVKALLGHRGPARKGWDDPDEMPILVLSEILGGGGTVSRLRARLRAREWLVYRASATLTMGQHDHGELQVFFETEGSAVPRALEVVVGELRLLQTERVPVAELELAKDSLLAASALLFESAEKTAGRFAEDELLGRPHAYWSSYGERIRKVKAADVQRVARAHLEPEKLVILLVGRWVDLSSFESALRKVGGSVTHLPARDPVTLEPVKAQAPKTTQAP